MGHRLLNVRVMRLKTNINIGFLVLFTVGQSLQGVSVPNNAVGRVVTVKGNILVRGQSLRAGDYILQQDVIETDANSAAKLLLNDRTIVDIFPSSSFKVNEFK